MEGFSRRIKSKADARIKEMQAERGEAVDDDIKTPKVRPKKSKAPSLVAGGMLRGAVRPSQH